MKKRHNGRLYCDDKYYGLLIEAYDGLTESIGMKKVGEEDDR